jgi:MFS family permease
MRLLDLHAVSCAGDTLITIGLAGTIFFNVPAGEARGRVALYLLITMVPFALLAPVVGPLLDRFRHGRRLALATTMVGRAVLAWVIADNLFGFGLYPAAFGVLALSRAYGVARSAAVPRLLPPGLGLSEAGARASVYGTVAGAIVAPIGALAFAFGPQWPLRVASLIFLAGGVVALMLPPKADSEAPEVVPRVFQLPWRHEREDGGKILSGRLVLSALAGSASLRAVYGFLLLFLAFTIRQGQLDRHFFGIPFNEPLALGLVGGALALGTFASTAIGTRLRIRRPVRLQAIGLAVTAIAGGWAAIRFTLTTVALFCLVAAVASGLAKLAVDASIQEKIPDTVRASAFAHAETLLMLAWVSGGAIGLIPFLGGRWGVILAALAMTAAAVWSARMASRLSAEVLHGRTAAVPAQPGPAERALDPQGA